MRATTAAKVVLTFVYKGSQEIITALLTTVKGMQFDDYRAYAE